jgi:hypothetical protein
VLAILFFSVADPDPVPFWPLDPILISFFPDLGSRIPNPYS